MGRTSAAAKKRRDAKKSKKGGKAGCQGNFHGQRARFIDEYYPEFLTIKGKPRAVQNKYWKKCWDVYWGRFQWNLPLNQDPDPSFPPPPEETPEILEQKKLIIKLTQNRIKAHMRYRATAAKRKDHNPWVAIVQDMLAELETSTAPRKLPVWQHYMAKKSETINAALQERWPSAGLEDKDKLAFRGSIARELLERETDEYRKALEAEVDEMHALEMQEYEQSEKHAVLTDEESRQHARDNFATIMQPLLEVMRQHTGYYINVLAGVPLEDGEKDFDLKVVHAGKATGGRSWHGVEGRYFQHDVMPSYTRYLMATPEYEKRLARIARDGPDTSSTSTPHLNTSEDVGTTSTPGVAPSGDGTTTCSGRSSASPATTRTCDPIRHAKHSKSKAKGKKAAQDLSDEESASSSDEESESDDDDDDDDDEDEDEDEDEDGEGEGEGAGEGEGEGANNGQLSSLTSSQLPAGAEIPDPTALGFNEAMQRKITGMPEDERKLFLWLHRKASEYDIECLNQRANNEELLATLGFKGDFLANKGTKKAAEKKKNGGAVKGKKAADPARRSTRLQNPAPVPIPSPVTNTSRAPSMPAQGDSPAPRSGLNRDRPNSVASTRPVTAADPSSGCEPSALGFDGAEQQSANVRTFGEDITRSAAAISNIAPSQPMPSKSALDIDVTVWPQWVREAYEFLTSHAYGEDFDRVVRRWTKLEESYGWSSSNKGLATKNRPDAVAIWLRYGRNFGKTPDLGAEDKYAAQWWKWWSGLQPAWRNNNTTTGRPIMEGSGDWVALRHPGKNGLLMVLLALCWWRGIATEATMPDWTAALEDVHWTMLQLTEETSGMRKRSADANSEDQGENGTRKRSRR